MTSKSIERVVEMGLCIGCGICMSICPYQAIKIVKDNKNGMYKPEVGQRCTDCGLCVEACYGIGEDPELSLVINGRDDTYKNQILSPYLNCYTGYANEHQIRYSSASGGVVTALLLHILEEKMVDGILVTKMDERRPFEPIPFIARNKSELISAATSKYCPVPVGMAFRTIMEENGHYAVVGLPCHIYSIKKAESIYPDLNKKIVLHIGIFCGGMPNFLATEYLLRRLKIRKDEIKRIKYRGEGWPGKMLIELKGVRDNKLFLPYPEYWGGSSSLFLPYRCTLCADGFNKFADISCGDAWLPEYQSDTLGTSLIVTRNKIGEQLLNDAYEKGTLSIKKIVCSKVMQAQKSMVRFKIRNLGFRAQVLKTLGKPLPICNCTNLQFFPPTLSNYFYSVLFYLMRFIVTKRTMWPLLDAYYTLRKCAPKVLSIITRAK